MAHYDEDSLLEYVEGTSPVAEEIASHVAGCDACSSEAGEQRELIERLASAETWEDPAAAPRQFTLNVAAFAERARIEEEQAIVLCDQILTGPASWWAQRLRSTEGTSTAGVVKQLLERWRTMVEHSPSNALQVTALAIHVANALDVAQYPCDYVVKLRAQSYRDHAFVLSFLGRHPEALDFVDRAKRLFEQVPMPEYDLARVAVVKSAILRLIDRSDEAVALVREAARTFLRFGDRSRYLNARITEGAVLYDRGSTEEALAVWSAIDGDAALEETSKVRVAHNIASCYAALGQPERAAEYVRDCVAQYELLGMDTERTRSRWLLGRALVSSGRAAEAIPILRASWREFEQLDMIADAGLVALEIAEALLVIGEVDEVPAICRDVIAQFTRAGMASRAITALSFLREAVAIGQANASLIRHVHAFLRELPNEQPRLFAPPPGGVGE
jgi:tetratricopeptide (TPR) repeat protein